MFYFTMFFIIIRFNVISRRVNTFLFNNLSFINDSNISSCFGVIRGNIGLFICFFNSSIYNKCFFVSNKSDNSILGACWVDSLWDCIPYENAIYFAVELDLFFIWIDFYPFLADFILNKSTDIYLLYIKLTWCCFWPELPLFRLFL
jgi:hypothetical protein